MMIRYIYLLAIALTVSNCTSSKINNKTNVVEKKEKQFTTDFYNPSAYTVNKKKVYKLSERKSFDIRIRNLGTKNLFIPKPLTLGREVLVKLFIKNDITGEFEPYKQKSKIAISSSHYNASVYRREIDSIRNGQSLDFKNFKVDPKTIIVDEGSYFAEISIDLARFGYFRLITTELIFDVVSDSTNIEELEKSNIDILKRTEAEQYSASIKLRMKANKKKKSKAKKDSIN